MTERELFVDRRAFGACPGEPLLLARGDSVEPEDLLLGAGRSDGQVHLEQMTLEEVERHLIQRALARAAGQVNDAAKALGLSRSALYRRLERYKL